MADSPAARQQISFERPDVLLFGELTEDRAREFLDALGKIEPSGAPAIIEVTTIGGDAALARRSVLEIDSVRSRLDRRLVFVGKSHVQSAGVTLMSAFPNADRFLSRDCMLLIHCRQLERTLEIAGAMRSSVPMVKALLNDMEYGLKLEKENFERLIEGSDISLDELMEKALTNWYLTADEAQRRGLVAGLI